MKWCFWNWSLKFYLIWKYIVKSYFRCYEYMLLSYMCVCGLLIYTLLFFQLECISKLHPNLGQKNHPFIVFQLIQVRSIIVIKFLTFKINNFFNVLIYHSFISIFAISHLKVSDLFTKSQHCYVLLPCNCYFIFSSICCLHFLFCEICFF